jgi:Domain of unknown function (DUF1918)
MYAHVGDRLMADGDLARTALIIGTPHADRSPPYIVRWLSDGHIAMVSPGQFARLVRASDQGEAETFGPWSSGPWSCTGQGGRG